ncbi:MAG: hypothetical protein NTZ33_08170 [Bacteroidetes bacterium]|nr:hypothetical protein [Bacteroidota bacterium]
MEEDAKELIKRAILHVFVNKNKYQLDDNEKELIRRFFLFVLAIIISLLVFLSF